MLETCDGLASSLGSGSLAEANVSTLVSAESLPEVTQLRPRCRALVRGRAKHPKP